MAPNTATSSIVLPKRAFKRTRKALKNHFTSWLEQRFHKGSYKRYPLIWIIVGQRPTSLEIGAGESCLDTFSLVCHFSSFSLSLGDGTI